MLRDVSIQKNLTRSRQHLGVALIIQLVMLFSLLAYGAVQTWAITAVSAILLFTCFTMVMIYSLNPVGFSFDMGMKTAIIFALLLLIISLFQTVYFYTTLHTSYTFVIYLIFFFLAYFSFQRQKSLFFSLYLLLVISFVYAVAGLLLMNDLFVDASSYQNRFNLSFSFVSHNQFASFMQVAFWLALPLIHIYRGPKRTVLLGVATTFGIIVLLSLSRGAWVAFVISAIIFFVLLPSSNKRYWTWLPIFGVLLFVLLFNNMPIVDRIFTMQDLTEASPGRSQCWQGTWAYILHYLWLGSGAGTYQYIFPQYQPENIAHLFFKHAHNDYLELFAEFGLLGIMVLLTFLYFLYVPAIRFIVDQQSKKKNLLFRHICLGSLTACTSMLIHGVVEFNFHVPANTFVFVFCTAMVVTSVQQGTKLTEHHHLTQQLLKRKSHQFYTLAWLLPIMMTSWFTLQEYRSNQFVADAQQAIKNKAWEEVVRHSRQASDLSFGNINTMIMLANALQNRAMQVRIDYDQDAYLMASLKVIDKALVLFPFHGALWYKKAKLLQLLGNSQLALQSLQQSSIYLPSSFYIHQDLGIELLKQSRFDEAAIELATTLRLRPKNAAQLFSLLWQYKASENYLRRLLNNDPYLYSQAALFVLKKGSAESGVRFLEKAYHLNNTPRQAEQNTLILWEVGHKKEAIESAEFYLKAWPLHPALVHQITHYYRDTHMFKEAEDVLSTYLRIKPNDQQMYDMLIHIYSLQKKYTAAIALARKKISSNGTAYNYLLLAQVLRNQGEFRQALQAIKSGLSIDQSESQLQYYAGLLYQQLNMDALAISHWRQCANQQYCQDALTNLRARLGLNPPQ